MTAVTSDLHAVIQSILLSGPAGAEAPQEAQCILAAAGGAEHARHMAERRASGEPLAFVLGRQPFMGLQLTAAPGVLFPREETELLGWTAVRLIEATRHGIRPPRILDMCCGSGNLACGIAHHVADAKVWACDLTESCVALTRENVAKLGLQDRVAVAQGDLFAPLNDLALDHAFDMIVCNPPYISSTRLERDRGDLLAHEPREAFDGGPFGLTIYQRVIREAPLFLREAGRLLFEIGEGQERQLAIIAQRAGGYETPEFVNNAAGVPRVAVLKRLAG